jgi:hypothetical protein
VAQDEPQVSVGGLLEQAILGNNAASKEAVEKGTRKGVHAKENKEKQCEEAEIQRKRRRT